MNPTAFGRPRANELANVDNNLRVEKDGAGPSGLDYLKVAIANDKVVTGIVFAGVTHSFTGIPVTTPNAIRDKVLEIIGEKEFDLVVNVAYDGTNLEFSHVGYYTLSRLVTDDGNKDTTRYNDTILESKFSGSVVGTLALVDGEGNSETLANNDYDHVGTPATDDATATQLATDIKTALDALGIYSREVTAARDDTDEKYDVVIYGDANQVLTLGGVELEVSETEVNFKFA